MSTSAATCHYIDQIRTRMRGRGMTLQGLADATGADRGHLSRTLSGRHSPTVALMQRIADALGCELWEIFEPVAKF